jgi:carbon-monoxide dehydrogenase large subunit
MGMEGIGASVARKEDKRFITGKGRYTTTWSVPGMKHAAFVRSPHAHADIKKIDVIEARRPCPASSPC